MVLGRSGGSLSGQGRAASPFGGIECRCDSPPKHGHVLVSDVADDRIRIAYRPEPDFIGADSFTIHYQIRDQDSTYSVTVTP